jgi:hypothetical protein
VNVNLTIPLLAEDGEDEDDDIDSGSLSTYKSSLIIKATAEPSGDK